MFSSLSDENNSLRNMQLKNENEMKLLKEENIDLNELVSKFDNILIEFDNLKDENEKLNKQMIIYEHNENNFVDQISRLKHKVEELEKNLNIMDIEKEEIFNRNEILEDKLSKETKNFQNSKKLLLYKDKEIKNLNKKIDDIYEKMNNLNVRESYLEDKLDVENYQSRTTDDSQVIKFLDDSPHHNGSCLGSLYPDWNDEDDGPVSISITPLNIVRKMSQKEINNEENGASKYEYSTNRTEKSSTASIQSDIYKDFFLLSYQSLKLNAENIEEYNTVNPEYLYNKILINNIPFHKVNFYLIFSFHISYPRKLNQKRKRIVYIINYLVYSKIIETA
jgi:hypothetical protein